MILPRGLVEEWTGDPDWLASLPRLVAECTEQWDLDLETPFESPHALVIPAGDVVLKLNAPSHVEADHEADALACWDGRGAVVLLARDDDRRALLCERCSPGSHLSRSAVDDVPVATELVRRLCHVPTEPHRFRSLAAEADRWSDEITTQYAQAGRPFEQLLIDIAVDVFHSVDRSAKWLVNQDLHGENVLRAEREPWLVIDPKPVVGEREIDGVGLLRNANSVASVRRWLDALADLGLDRGRLRCWGIAHTIAWAWDTRSGWSPESVDIARRILAA